MVKLFKNRLTAAVEDPRNKEVPISTLISRFLLTYQNTEHSTTGKAPAQLMLGREVRTRWKLLKESREVQTEDNLPEKVRTPVAVQKRKYVGRKRQSVVGSIVYVKDYRREDKVTWTEAVVEKQIGRSVYLCRLKNGQLWKRHMNQIKTTSFENHEAQTSQSTNTRTRQPPVKCDNSKFIFPEINHNAILSKE
ncbi:uncharacterized protein K02A2.6, partial [Anoplophora glabripennis]|uniref:uncharacterized protein K02A2.6 n=1 Tax=Anoplophora glabripennis TaxID=217634 RepID=UPI00087361CB